MSKLKCFDGIKIPGLEAQFRAAINPDMTINQEKEVATNIAADYYKKLQGELNDLRTKVGTKEAPIIEPKPILAPKVEEKKAEVPALPEELQKVDAEPLPEQEEDLSNIFGNFGEDDSIMDDIAAGDKPLSNAEQNNNKPENNC